jgi:uncharacterized membrane protein
MNTKFLVFLSYIPRFLNRILLRKKKKKKYFFYDVFASIEFSFFLPTLKPNP